MKVVRFLLSGALIWSIATQAIAQSLGVGSIATEDYFRRAQLQSKVDTTISLTIRPLYPSFFESQYLKSDTSLGKYNWIGISEYTKAGSITVAPLPITIQTQFNSNHPYGWNDGPMIPAKGFQTMVSFGAFAQLGPLTIQFKPEIVTAENTYFESFNKNQYDVIFARYYDIYNNIDLPVRFGDHSYVQAFWGQSSIRLNLKAWSFGLSTENLWWGPGIRNSLLMSNSAPGFPHLTLNTSSPLKTPIGSFEGQLIAGRLNNSNFAPLVPDHSFFGTNLYVPKPNDWRYLSGIIITWQPKWVPGLFLGYDQSAQMYGKNMGGIKSYLPIFSSVKSTTAPDKQINTQDQLSSMFARWIWLQEHAEIYFEYGHYNNFDDLYQSMLRPDNSRAYTFGLRKLLPFKNLPNQNIMLGVEVTQLGNTSAASVTQGQEWYVSRGVRQGYTNFGQMLGAGIGPGGNLQSLDISWVKGLKRLGLQIERYVHDDDFYYYAFYDSKNYSQHWVDLSLGFTGEWNYKDFIFNAKLQGIQSNDYQWAVTQNGDDITFSHQLHQFNLQLQAGFTYRF
ncbi:MAG TPA: capsule assembly Wzi family protein [Mucilaginibacter sp.]